MITSSWGNHRRPVLSPLRSLTAATRSSVLSQAHSLHCHRGLSTEHTMCDSRQFTVVSVVGCANRSGRFHLVCTFFMVLAWGIHARSVMVLNQKVLPDSVAGTNLTAFKFFTCVQYACPQCTTDLFVTSRSSTIIRCHIPISSPFQLLKKHPCPFHLNVI